MEEVLPSLSPAVPAIIRPRYVFFSTLEDGMHVLTGTIVTHSALLCKRNSSLLMIRCFSWSPLIRIEDERTTEEQSTPQSGWRCKAYLSQEGELLTALPRSTHTIGSPNNPHTAGWWCWCPRRPAPIIIQQSLF